MSNTLLSDSLLSNVELSNPELSNPAPSGKFGATGAVPAKTPVFKVPAFNVPTTTGAPAGEIAGSTEMNGVLFSTALDAYLSSLLTVGECVAAATPEVGEACKQRLSRLRARVAFQPTPAILTEAANALDAELKDYASAATRQTARYNAELRREITSFHEIIEAMSRRQEFFANRLRQFVRQMEGSPYPSDPDDLATILELQAAGLRTCIESMTAETASLVTRMRQEMTALDERLSNVQGLDPVTGLIDRDEMLRQIATHRDTDAEFTLIRLDVEAPAGDEVMRQAADRLLAQFRHYDRVARWGKREFLVLFQGPRERAEKRSLQVLPWLTSQYKLTSGECTDVAIAVRIMDTSPDML